MDGLNRLLFALGLSGVLRGFMNQTCLRRVKRISEVKRCAAVAQPNKSNIHQIDADKDGLENECETTPCPEYAIVDEGCRG